MKGSKTPPIRFKQIVDLTFTEPEDSKGQARSLTIPVEFGEMDQCADTMLVGWKQLAEWGFATEVDDEGDNWVVFKKLGLRFMAETPASSQ